MHTNMYITYLLVVQPPECFLFAQNEMKMSYVFSMIEIDLIVAI